MEPTPPSLPVPKSIKVLVKGYWGTPGEKGLMPQLLAQQGWQTHELTVQPQRHVRRIYSKSFREGTLYRISENYSEVHVVRDLTDRVVKKWVVPADHTQFLEVDARGRVIFGDHGCLWAWNRFQDRKRP